MKITIRKERESDLLVIKNINDMAFEQDNEGILVEKLRKRPEFIRELSLVAEFQGDVVGHILFFPISIKTKTGFYSTISLAPMAVIPEFQNQGIGGQLVNEGLAKVKELGHKSVVVLGHPEYYPRFRFRKASEWKLTVPFPCPDEAMMALEFEQGTLKTGMIEFLPEYFEAL